MKRVWIAPRLSKRISEAMMPLAFLADQKKSSHGCAPKKQGHYPTLQWTLFGAERLLDLGFSRGKKERDKKKRQCRPLIMPLCVSRGVTPLSAGFTLRLCFLCLFLGTLMAQSPYSSDLVTGDTRKKATAFQRSLVSVLWCMCWMWTAWKENITDV